MAALRVPPGRAGRLWLRDRLALAESGLSLLDRKLALLEPEYTRLAAESATAARAWTESCLRAREWQLRAAMLEGEQALAERTAPPVTITIRYTTLAGVRLPVDADLQPPHDIPRPTGTSATRLAMTTAHRESLTAAARHAVAAAAARELHRELTATRTRVRALRHHRIPALRTALATLELQLEEQERSDRARLHRPGP